MASFGTPFLLYNNTVGKGGNLMNKLFEKMKTMVWKIKRWIKAIFHSKEWEEYNKKFEGKPDDEAWGLKPDGAIKKVKLNEMGQVDPSNSIRTVKAKRIIRNKITGTVLVGNFRDEKEMKAAHGENYEFVEPKIKEMKYYIDDCGV